jgi:hypothetical protein
MKHAALWEKHIVPTIRRDSWMDDDDFRLFLDDCLITQGSTFDAAIDDGISKGADPEQVAALIAKAMQALR